jgi:hypothetical protein
MGNPPTTPPHHPHHPRHEHAPAPMSELAGPYPPWPATSRVATRQDTTNHSTTHPPPLAPRLPPPPPLVRLHRPDPTETLATVTTDALAGPTTTHPGSPRHPRTRRPLDHPSIIHGLGNLWTTTEFDRRTLLTAPRHPDRPRLAGSPPQPNRHRETTPAPSRAPPRTDTSPKPSPTASTAHRRTRTMDDQLGGHTLVTFTQNTLTRSPPVPKPPRHRPGPPVDCCPRSPSCPDRRPRLLRRRTDARAQRHYITGLLAAHAAGDAALAPASRAG